MATELLPFIEMATGERPTATVILLHGLGADGNDFAPLVAELRLPSTLVVRFIFPHAPVRAVTINNGMRMRAWYDIAAADLNSRADLAGVRQSQGEIDALIASEVARGTAPSRIVLAGFSQGGVVALQSALRYPQRLAGVMALSCYLVAPDRLAAEVSQQNRDVPIFMAHGIADPVVRFDWAEASRRVLEANGFKVEWHAYRMEHSVCGEEVRDASAWLQRVLAPA